MAVLLVRDALQRYDTVEIIYANTDHALAAPGRYFRVSLSGVTKAAAPSSEADGSWTTATISNSLAGVRQYRLTARNAHKPICEHNRTAM